MRSRRLRSLGLCSVLVLVLALTAGVRAVQRTQAALPPLIQSMSCSPNPAPVNQPVACSAYVQRDATVSATYQWDLGDGTTYTATSAAPTIPAHSYSSCGTYTVTLAVTDTAGGAAQRTFTEVVTGCTSQPSGSPPASIPPGQGTPTGCVQWDISGTWHAPASDSYHPTFVFQQGAPDSAGTASLAGTVTLDATDGPRAGFSGAVTGTLSGTLHGDQLDFVVTWPAKPDGSQPRGHYTGTVTASGISGTTRDENVPNGPTGAWSVVGTADCVEGVGGGPSATPPATPQPTPAPVPTQVSTDTGGSSALGPLDLAAYCRAGGAVLVMAPDGPYCQETEDLYVPVLPGDLNQACQQQYNDPTATARSAGGSDPNAYTCYSGTGGQQPAGTNPPTPQPTSAPGWPNPYSF